MIPWELVDSAAVPGSRQQLHLYKRGEEFSIRVNHRELMNSRVHGSEEALAELTCARISRCPSPRLLIGGLGMGYTLAAALARLPAKAQVVVAELVPAVVEWNKGLLGALAGHPLRDRRVVVREVDVAQVLKTAPQGYDAILLDVDNGPEALGLLDNDWLYTMAGLEAAFESLRHDGVLGIWSPSPNRSFTQRLRRAGFAAEEVQARARGPRGGGRVHTIWIAQRRTPG